MKRKIISIMAVVAICLALVGSTSARVITVEVEGVVDYFNTEGGFALDGSVGLGSVMTGFTTYDTDTANLGDSITGLYNLISISMTIGNYTFTHDPTSTDPAYFMVSTVDPSYLVTSDTSRFDGTIYVNGLPKTYDDIAWSWTPLDLFWLSTSSSEYFTTDALPDLDSWPDLSVFDVLREFGAGFTEGSGGFYISGEVTSLTVVPEPAKTYYVDADEGSDDNDGLSPQTAFATIQKAIDSAFNGDTVIVADGTYTGPGNRDIDFLGKAITLKSENGPENCIIDCNGTEAEPHRGFYFHSGESAGSVLDGFSITNALGGDRGIYCKDSSPTITNCIVTNGSIGIGCSRSNPTISNCIISGNFCIGHGGGIFCYKSSPTITNCTISGNWADWGGGISCYKESNPTIINCTISGNSAMGGGGISCWSASPTITNCTISNNSAEHFGGGIYNSRGNPTFTNCTFIGNSTEDSGGAIYCYNSNSTIANCTISSNTAKNGGGGIYCHWYTIATITNCRFTGNSADFGGGINCCSGSVTITNCTFSGNSARRGGAIKGDDTTITNCILWGNTADEIHGCWGVYWRPGDGGPPWLNVTFSNVQGGYEGEGNIDSDPCFLDPGYWDANDTPDDANDDFWVEGDYHLLRTSPCIDAANDANVYTDIEGNIRPFDFPGVDNNGELPEFDMGAYELVPVEAAMKFTPQMLNCNSKGKYIKAHFVLPEGFLPEDVDVNEPALAEPMGAESESIKVLGAGTGPVELEICFDRKAFCYLLTDDDSLEVTVIGSLTTSRYFYATDTIKIKP